LRETETPGHVRAFVLIDKKVHLLTINVPRQLFINTKGSDLPDIEVPGCVAERVYHTLPNGHPSTMLFKLTMSEEVYVQESQRVAAICNHPSVEGVYEKQVPLTVRAVLQLGNTCTFDEGPKGVLGRGLEHGFALAALRRCPAEQPYLVEAEMGFIYLYHVVAGDRQIFALFSTLKDEAHIVVFNKSKDTQGLPNADKIYSDLLKRRLEENGGKQWQNMFEYQDRMHFRSTQVTTKRKLYRELGDTLKKIRSDEDRPTVLVLQSPHSRLLLYDIPALRDMPVLKIRTEASDSNLPPLGWQRLATKRLITHYLTLGSWVSHLVELARYGDAPLCNLEKDDPRFLIDLAYARRLQKSNVVLWWSGGPLPDHAGHEKDDILGSMETVEMPAVNNPGTYSSVCIELDVRNLAINTILTSSLINEIDGAGSVAFNPGAPTEDDPYGGGGPLVSETAFASAGVTVLREMVKAWWTEACKGSSMADVMVQHLVRWVESPDSLLYDPSLHYYVQMMSRKAFQQLMTDFRRVGSHVVFANPNRLLLQTTKGEVGNAYAYSQYILKSIKAKPLFHFLDLELKEYWDYLVWYDQFNYGGKACREVVEAEAQTLDTIMHWQLSTFLPAQYQTVFHDWIVEFIELMHIRKRPRHDIPIGSDPPNSTARLTQLPAHRTDIDDDDARTSQNILTHPISKPLKRQLLALISRHRSELAHPTLASDHSFPLLPGSHLPNLESTNPVFQLTKSLLHIFSLDKSISLEVRLLRQDLLALFDIKEFSPQARFENPSESLVLQQVVCEQCTMSRDLDLCRDEDLMPPDPASPEAGGDGAPGRKLWQCSTCGHPYPMVWIEERLVARVQKMLVEWQTQDLRCRKCTRFQVNGFMENCGCGGEWEGS
ncbi:MAG: hypothetical protein Q9211_007038, partial [Gyalolechia sp. 1 TL-2023]